MTVPGRRRLREEGQSTVEFALCLPFVALAIALLIGAGAIASAQVRLWHAAREAARAAAVDSDHEKIRAAADRSGLERLSISVRPQAHDRTQGGPVTVVVAHRPIAGMPVVGLMFDSVELEARATMRVETP